MATTRSIKTTTDKNGRRIHMVTGGGLTRWVRISQTDAELMISTGKAVRVDADTISQSGWFAR